MSALNEGPKAHGRRALLAGGVLLMIGVAAATTYFRADPSSAEQVSSDMPTAITPGTPGRSASEAALPQAAAPPSAPPRSGAASAGKASFAVPTPGIGASAAMRDYGQIVIAAVNGGTPKQLGAAVKLMSMCRFNPELLQIMEKMKSEGRFSGDTDGTAMRHFNEQGRKCQSIPPDLMAREKEIAERALLGGARGVAIIYAGLVDFDPPPSIRRPLGEALRADFLEGDDIAPLQLAKHADLFELTRIETRAYEIAFEAQKHRMKDSWNPDGFAKPVPALTADEQRQAEVLAQTWLQSVKKPKMPWE